MKEIPNLLTLCNLLCGCVAIVLLLQNGFQLIESDDGMGFLTSQELMLNPESIYLAPLFIALAAVIDFFDGFFARLLNAAGEMGKQLDSLADVVSFGVAPGMIVYQFLRLGLASQPNGLQASFIWLLPAFVLPMAAAYRLARFNIDDHPSHYFRGTPVPSVGLTVAAFPLIYWNSNNQLVLDLFTNKWLWYALVMLLSWLMISNIPIMSNKPKNLSVPALTPYAIVMLTGIVSFLVLGWWCVPATFAAFVIVSIIFKKQII